MPNSRKLYTIQQISRKLEVPRSTIRYWEKELEGILVPIRTPGGQRRYTREHLATIDAIKKLQSKDLRLAEIREELTVSRENTMQQTDILNLEFLTDRIAAMVKTEVYNFLSRTGKP